MLLLETAIVILNYNGTNHLRTFLPSVISNSADIPIYVIDNGSTDDSLDVIKSEFPDVQLVILTSNLGFAGGYNEGLKQISSKYYILLNSDVEVTDGWVEPLINRLKSDSSIAACQPKIKSYLKKDQFEYAGAAGGYLDYLGYPFCRGRVFDTCEKDEGQYDESTQVFWATGACLVIKSELFWSAGGFDASFFAHMEEIDLCWRLNNRGYKIWSEMGSTVFHLGAGTLSASNPRKTFLNYRNSLLMLYKNLPSGVAFFRILTRLILDGISGLKLIVDGKWKDCIAIIRAHFAFYAMIGKTRKDEKASGRKLSNFSVVFEYFVINKKKYDELSV